MDNLGAVISAIEASTALSTEQYFVDMTEVLSAFIEDNPSIHDDALFRAIKGVVDLVCPERWDLQKYALIQMAMVNNNLGHFTIAENIYGYLLETLEAEDRPNVSDIAFVYSGLGSSLNALGKYELAYEAFSKSTAILERKDLDLVNRDGRLALAANNAGLALSNLQRNKEALQLFRKALRIRGFILPEGHPDLVATQNNLAAVLAELGFIEESNHILSSTAQSLREAGNENYPEYIAMLFLRSKNFFKANDIEQSYRHAGFAYEAAIKSGEPGRGLVVEISNYVNALHTLHEVEGVDQDTIDAATKFLRLGWGLDS